MIALGDFNGRIGMDNAKFAYHEDTNRHGQILMDFAQENNLVITNITFQKAKLWTCVLPSGYRAQLDYVLVRRKWANRHTTHLLALDPTIE